MPHDEAREGVRRVSGCKYAQASRRTESSAALDAPGGCCAEVVVRPLAANLVQHARRDRPTCAPRPTSSALLDDRRRLRTTAPTTTPRSPRTCSLRPARRTARTATAARPICTSPRVNDMWLYSGLGKVSVQVPVELRELSRPRVSVGLLWLASAASKKWILSLTMGPPIAAAMLDAG